MSVVVVMVMLVALPLLALARVEAALTLRMAM